MGGVTEEELKAGAVAPRVTKEEVLASIKSTFYFTAGDGVRGESELGTSPAGSADVLNRMTFCVLVLANGFTVTGQSACVSAANFNEEVGRRLAYEDAFDKIWAFLGFELATKIQAIMSVPAPSGSIAEMFPQTYYGTKVVHATPMTRLEYNKIRGWEVPADEDPTDEGYLVEYTDGGRPNVPGFTGYVSWSPRDIFERAYSTGTPRKETFIDRLKREYDEVNERHIKLLTYMQSPAFKDLPHLDINDMTNQEKAMSDYAWNLRKRLKRLTTPTR